MNLASFKKNLKIFWKPFLIVFLIFFLIINWQRVSWIFNYRVISGIFSDFFKKENLTINSNNSEDIKKNSPLFEYSEKENSLEIPKIEISAPLVLVNSEKEVYKALDRGVVLFPSSVLPGESDQTIILGHSAPVGWPKIKYDWVFSRLNELEIGDEIFVYFNHQKYPYLVVKKIFLERGEEIPEDLTSSENMLILISCWPPGKDLRRIAVAATIKNK